MRRRACAVYPIITFAGVPWLRVVAAVCRRTIADALRAGAAGAVDRHASADEFADALGRVAAGAIREAALRLAHHVPSEPAAFAFAPVCSSPG